jgi:hypothetical protein
MGTVSDPDDHGRRYNIRRQAPNSANTCSELAHVSTNASGIASQTENDGHFNSGSGRIIRSFC